MTEYIRNTIVTSNTHHLTVSSEMAGSNTSEPATSVKTVPLPGLLSEDSYSLLMNVVLCVDTLIGFFATGANIMTIAVYRKNGLR